MHSSGSTTPALEAGKKVSEDRGREFVWMPRYARIFFDICFCESLLLDAVFA